jgi:peptidoglycan/LPS O-acetylase OafA/YrhL
VSFWLAGHGGLRENGRISVGYWAVYIFPPARMLEFLTGLAMFRFRDRIAMLPFVEGLEIVSIVGLFGLMIILPLAAFPEIFRLQLAYFPVMCLLLVCFINGGGLIAKFLARSSVLIALGDASFCLYLIHMLWIKAAFKLAAPFEGYAMIPLIGFGAIVMAVVFAVIAHRYVEVPLNRWLSSAVRNGLSTRNYAVDGSAPQVGTITPSKSSISATAKAVSSSPMP